MLKAEGRNQATRLSMNDATMITAKTVNRIRWVRSRRWWLVGTLRVGLRFAIAGWMLPHHPAQGSVPSSWMITEVRSEAGGQANGTAQPSARGSLPPVSTPLSKSRRMI